MLVGAVVLTPATLFAQWDQQQANDVAARFSAAVDEILADSETRQQSTAIDTKNIHAAKVDLKFLGETARELSDALRRGENAVQTYATYDQLRKYRNSIRDYLEGIDVPQGIRQRAEEAQALFQTLDGFYKDGSAR